MGGSKTFALIDTGANLSVMSKQFLDKTPYSTRFSQPSIIRSVKAVNGEHVKVLGKLDILITIGDENSKL